MGLFFYKWSRVAASNSSADTNVNWAEGMAPSAVNDSARAMMASAAGYRDDIAGAIVTGGTSTAYTVTSNQVFDSLANMSGAVIAFTPHATNGGTTTLNVDSLGAKALRSAPGVELSAGMLVAGTPYTVLYNNSDAAFYLHNFIGFNPYNIPVGGALAYYGSAAPNSAFVLPYGQAISRTTYATLFTLISTTFGSGDGSTTFNVPDLRGRFMAGADAMGGIAANRITSTYLGAAATVGNAGGAQSHTLTTAQLPAHTHANSLNDPGHGHTHNAITGGGSTTGGGGFVIPGGTGATINANTTGITITNASAGSGDAHPILPPTHICNFILRII